jgi:hypothetical protein
MILLAAVLLAFGLVVLARWMPQILESWLARIGASIVLVTALLLAFVPALVTGLLFILSAPVGVLMIGVGAVRCFITSGKQVDTDIAALEVAARHTDRVWPDDPPLRQADEMTKHGIRAAPGLLALLRFESDQQLRDETWSPSLEQQAALALCRIYGEPPAGARTVYDRRATAAENRQVKSFWEMKVAR